MNKDQELYRQYLASKSKPSDEELYQQYLTSKSVPDANLESAPSTLMSAVRKGAQGLSGGLSDEFSGLIEAAGRMGGVHGAGGAIKDINFQGDPTMNWDDLKQAYNQGRDLERTGLQKDEKYNPGVSALSDIAGSVFSPVNKISKGTSLAKFMGNALATGAIQGAGRSESEDLLGLLKDTATDTAVSGLFGLGSKGVGAAANYVTPKIGSVMSGIREETIRKAKEILPQLRDAKINPQIALNKIEQGKDSINSALSKAKQSAYKGMSEVTDELDSRGDLISTEEIIAPIKQKIASLRNSKYVTQADIAKADELENLVNTNLTKRVKTTVDGQEVEQFIAPEMIDASTANKLYKDIKNLAMDEGLQFKNLGTARSTLSGAADPEVTMALRDSMKNAKNSITTAANNQGDDLGQKYLEGNRNYSQLKGLEDDLFNVTKNPKAFDQFLRRTDTTSKGLKSKISEVTGVNTDKIGNEIQAYNMFSQPTWASKSLDGSTSTSRTVPMALLGGAAGGYLAKDSDNYPLVGAASLLGAGLGSKMGSTAALMKYMQMGQASKELGKKIPDNLLFNTYLNMRTKEKDQ